MLLMKVLVNQERNAGKTTQSGAFGQHHMLEHSRVLDILHKHGVGFLANTPQDLNLSRISISIHKN